MAEIGIMQGRLSAPYEGRIQNFPTVTWRDEFPAAAAAGLDFIEWIYDEFGVGANPLETPVGQAEMRALSQSSGVRVNSICADLFMERPLLKCSPGEQADRLALLEQVFSWGAEVGVRYLVLPFVDNSRMENEAEVAAFVALMRDRILPIAERHGIEAHLETSLPPDAVAGILEQIPHDLFRINYDSGNSSSLGYKPADEFRAYGPRIGSFHVKDRVLGGTTVPLGTGDADFAALRAGLKEIGYGRSFVLQVARGEPGGEIAWASANRRLAEQLLDL